MSESDKQLHWDSIYQTISSAQLSWHQATPLTSLEFIQYFNIAVDDKIVDVGGGDSFFVDRLIESGYKNITVLDISKTAITAARQRLGAAGEKVQWIMTDVLAYQPPHRYDFWHDRASFHFLTRDEEIEQYVHIAAQSVRSGGALVLGTFAETGPPKCSGLPVRRYSEKAMAEATKNLFEIRKCIPVVHLTPSGNSQDFIFCGFNRL